MLAQSLSPATTHLHIHQHSGQEFLGCCVAANHAHTTDCEASASGFLNKRVSEIAVGGMVLNESTFHNGMILGNLGINPLDKTRNDPKRYYTNDSGRGPISRVKSSTRAYNGDR
eukprot:4898056-Amphidinium_carterae.2